MQLLILLITLAWASEGYTCPFPAGCITNASYSYEKGTVVTMRPNVDKLVAELEHLCGDVWCEMDHWYHFYNENERVTVVRIPHCHVGRSEDCERGPVLWRSCAPEMVKVEKCINELEALP